MRASTAVIVAAVAVASAAPRAAQDPAVGALLNKGNEYLTSYVQRASGASLDESYTLTEVSSGAMTVPVRISSEIVFVNVNGRLHSMRDATAISGAKIKDAGGRLVPLLANPTQAGWQQAQQHAQEVYRYMGSELIVRMNDPMLALHFIQPPVHGRFTYRIDGRKKLNGVDTTGLRFEETRGELTKYFMGTRGNGYLTGRLWTDPATGAVHATEIWLESRTETARSNVTYAFHKDLDLLLPSKTSENYDTRPAPEGMINRGEGGYGARQSFQVNATYANPKHTPVDLTKMR